MKKLNTKSFARKVVCAALVGTGLLFANPAQAVTTNIISGQLTGTNNWISSQVYQLNGAVWVMSNAVLNIQAGTVVAGKNLGTGTNNVAALYITQGGKIFAQGNATNPIIFTAAIDDTTIPDDMNIWGSTARGQWGGLVILGQAPINGAIDTTGNAATPKYEVYEGLPDEVVGGQNVFRFGGTNENDDSGILRYVSIRHGGAVLAPNKEINGLSLGAVGRGTTIEYVESYCAADDGFEFFGGTVNTKYLVSSFNDDDSFDTDMGYSGTNQFWFAIQAPDKRNYGMELNSQPNELINSNNAAPILPRGTFQLYNLTIIGAGTGSTNLNGGGNDGIALRPFASPSIYNAVFTDFNGQGIRLDTQNGLSGNNVVNSNYAAINNTLWWGFVTNAGTGSQAVDNSIANLARGSATGATFWNTGSYTNQISNPYLVSITRTNDGVNFLDPRPLAASPVYQNYAAAPAGLTPVNYRGAFGTNLWVSGWTALSEYGILAGPALTTVKLTNIVSGQLTGTNNWFANQVYQLNGAAWVMSNAVLNIEAGTVVAGKNLGTGTNNVAALYITQGGKIFAQGTANNPIIFTAAIDDTTIPDDMPIWGPTARGQWGGLVVLGQAPINGAIDTTGNAATPKYEVYEGLPDEVVGGQNVFRFGGTNDNDDSGIIRYVSIRHGGSVLAPNKEINGLSLGAVGRGTTIEYVESYCAADDGFEFFGGTVNTKYLVSSFNDDDSFDTDMGYNGKNQFWFAIQAPDKRNYGMELNSQPNELINSNNAAPITPRGTFQLYNLTIIGAGTSSTNLNGGGDDAVTLRPFASPSIYNAVFTDFNGQGIRLDTQNGLSANNVVNSNYAAINNSLWWGFVTNAGTGSQAVDNSIANLARGSATGATFWNTAAFSNTIANPMLTSITRTNDGVNFLDPRPQTGSPALTSSTTAPNDGFYSPVAFKGAFDRTNLWIRGWTALDGYAMLTSSNPPALLPPSSPTITSSFGVGTVTFSINSQLGYNYALQSTLVLNPAAWTNLTSLPGNGGTLTFPPVASTNATEFFRILAQ